MRRVNYLQAAATALIVLAASTLTAAPPHTITLDGQANEWNADEIVAVQTKVQGVNGFDFGAQKYMANLYVTWDAANLYIGIDGDMSGTGNDGVVVFIDNAPGPAPGNMGQAGTSAINNTSGASNALLSNGNVNFPDNLRPDLGVAVFMNGSRVKLVGAGSGSDAAIYNVQDGTTFAEGSLNGAMILGSTSGTTDDFEVAIPWTDVFGGPLPANGEIGVFCYINATSGFLSSIFLPGLQSPTAGPLNNIGDTATVSLNTDPGLTGFVRIPVTDAGGALLTAVNETLDSTGGPDPLNLNNVEQVFDLDLLQVSFTDDVVLDANAETLGNYTLTDQSDVAIPGVTISSAVRGTGPNTDQVYLGLSAPIPSAQGYKLVVSGVTANAGGNTMTGPQNALNTSFRLVTLTMDKSGAGEDLLPVLLNFGEPLIRGEWDGFFRRTPLTDTADAFPNIPGNQSADAVNGDNIFTANLLVTDNAAQPWNYVVNSVIDIPPGSDVGGQTTQFVGVGYYLGAPMDLVLAAVDTTVALTDPVENRTLVQDTTVHIEVTFPGTFATPAQLQAGFVRVQGGTTLGGFGVEGVIEPMATGGANIGIPMTFVSADGSNNSTWECDVMFPAGVLDVAEFRFVCDEVDGLPGNDFYESAVGTVHAHTFRITEADRLTPNDQTGLMWETVSYDVPNPVANVAAAKDWALFE